MIFLVVVLLFSISPARSQPKSSAPVYEYTKVNTFPHDPTAFTQGLLYPADEVGYLYEGTGLYGKSLIRKVRLATGEVVQEKPNANPAEFGEGIVIHGSRIYQLTWQQHVINVYDRATLALLDTLPNPREGWGLTTDGDWLIMSDGTEAIFFLHPANCSVARQIIVRNGGKRVRQLNELEYIKGEIWSNVWQTDLVHVIDPRTGDVTRTIDFRRLQPVRRGDVLNGIAYDAATNKVYVTGKLWPELYEIRVKDTCVDQQQPCPPFDSLAPAAAAPTVHPKPMAAAASAEETDGNSVARTAGFASAAVVALVVVVSVAAFALRRSAWGAALPVWRLFDTRKSGDSRPQPAEGARSLKRRGRSKY
eukprot:TRINITY_DN9962_c0_g2_i1.p1 TRINITY_DN9962_c0_g2~~TRINITY_DN9962_c0_g2_i1.p1  ORF type:complete len:363 (-),score=105.20 TRINITY_DN9962_c0_g2_i1:559-1647(-)